MKQGKTKVLAAFALSVMFAIAYVLMLGGESVGGAMEVAIGAIAILGICAFFGVGFAVALYLLLRITRGQTMKQDNTEELAAIALSVVFVALMLGGESVGGAMKKPIEIAHLIVYLGICAAVLLDLLHRISRIK